jgi:hypothetical protein
MYNPAVFPDLLFRRVALQPGYFMTITDASATFVNGDRAGFSDE